MSFTSEIKKEIANHDKFTDIRAKKAGISAFVRTSGTMGFVDGTPSFFLVSETETVAEFFMSVFSETFETELAVTHATMDKKRGRDKLVMQCPTAYAHDALKALKLLKRDGNDFKAGISTSLVSTEESRIAYIVGAFLGGGSCSLPTSGSGYHLEIVFNEKRTAIDFCALLDSFELFAKLVERKESFVAYMKSKEAISDFLSIIGAENALKKFTELVEKRDESNRDNRAKNCMAGNADKSAIAAVKQVVAIGKLQDKTGFSGLSEELYELARARLAYPSSSLKELAERLGISKSCLNHRMRKLMEIAEETAKGESI